MKKRENDSTFRLLTALAASLALGMLATTAQAGLLGYWNFNEASGNALDSSGNGFTGTLTGPASRVAGPSGFGNAMSFGSHGYVDVLNSAASSLGLLNTNYTITFWVKSNGAPSGYGGLVNKYTDADTNGYSLRCLETPEQGYADGKIIAYANTEIRPVEAPFGQEQWDYFSLVVSGLGEYTYPIQDFYRNGAWVSGGVYSRALLTNNTANLTFGNSNLEQEADGWNFNGSLDEIRIYDEALGVAAIQALMVPVPEPAAMTLLVWGVMAFRRHRKNP